MKTTVICCLLPLSGMAAAPDCLQPQPVPVTLRLREGHAETVQHLLLSGGQQPALRMVDAATGALRWSAAALAPASQLFPSMHAAFAGSLAVLDLDGDGLHDRLYAGDLAGRVWRFDIHQGAAADALLTGGIFAQLGDATSVRAFLAPPDVSLGTLDDAPWFNIAMGTASPATLAVDNRFYLLRDHAPYTAWSQAEYARWQPLRDADLQQIAPQSSHVAAEPIPSDGPGYFFSIGRQFMLAPSITVSGRAAIVLAQHLPDSADGCAVAIAFSSLALHDARPAMDLNGDGVIDGADQQVVQSLRVPASTAISLSDPTNGEATCQFGSLSIPGCSVSTRPVRTWWRREDAD